MLGQTATASKKKCGWSCLSFSCLIATGLFSHVNTFSKPFRPWLSLAEYESVPNPVQILPYVVGVLSGILMSCGGTTSSCRCCCCRFFVCRAAAGGDARRRGGSSAGLRLLLLLFLHFLGFSGCFFLDDFSKVKSSLLGTIILRTRSRFLFVLVVVRRAATSKDQSKSIINRWQTKKIAHIGFDRQTLLIAMHACINCNDLSQLIKQDADLMWATNIYFFPATDPNSIGKYWQGEKAHSPHFLVSQCSQHLIVGEM